MVHAILSRSFRWFAALAVVLCLSAPAAAAVAVLNNPGTDNRANGSATNTLSFAMSTGSNLALVALFTYDNTNFTLTSIVWDSGGTNQTMTLIPGTTSTNGACTSVLYGLVGTITTGTHNVVATTTGTTNSYISLISFTGVNQTGGATSFPNGRSNTGTSSAPSSGAITSATGDAVVGNGCAATQSVSTVSDTTVYNDSGGASVNGFGNEATGAATVTLTGTLAGSSVWSYSGADVAQPAAAVNCGRAPALHAGC